jgi:hypothetical protein
VAGEWQVGDLALCVKVIPDPSDVGPQPEVGCVYTVARVWGGGSGLTFEDLPCTCPRCGSESYCVSWLADLFKKIPPRKKQATRFDFRTLLSPAPSAPEAPAKPKKTKELEPA